MSSCKPTHLFSDAPRRCIRCTTTDWRPYRSSHVGCRFGRSGSSGLVGRLLRLRLSNREPVLKDRRNPDWCRYRYICRPVGFLAVNGCRPKRIRIPLRGRLKLLRFSDGLLNCKNKTRVHAFGYTYYVRATACFEIYF